MDSNRIIGIHLRRGKRTVIEFPSNLSDGSKVRLEALYKFIRLANREILNKGFAVYDYAIQLDDESPDQYCFRFDANINGPQNNSPLIPDPYTLATNGYQKIQKKLELLPPWNERIKLAIWRGSTTGLPALTTSRLKHLTRYQLCRLSETHPGLIDAKFTGIVQCQNPAAEQGIGNEFVHRNLLVNRMEPEHMALHRWIIDVDGNVNSWGFLWKLISGSCILRVNSEHYQWYHHLLKPWVHYVPIESDLSDAIHQLKWCRAHPQQCESIAANGERLGLSVIDSLEADQKKAVEQYLERVS